MQTGQIHEHCFRARPKKTRGRPEPPQSTTSSLTFLSTVINVDLKRANESRCHTVSLVERCKWALSDVQGIGRGPAPILRASCESRVMSSARRVLPDKLTTAIIPDNIFFMSDLHSSASFSSLGLGESKRHCGIISTVAEVYTRG